MSEPVNATLIGGPHDGKVYAVEQGGWVVCFSEFRLPEFLVTFQGSDPLAGTVLRHRYRWESLEPPRLIFCGTEEINREQI